MILPEISYSFSEMKDINLSFINTIFRGDGANKNGLSSAVAWQNNVAALLDSPK